MSSLCVIPARGGSKRIPHKNIREFCGKPIIAYSIEAALESNLFDEVMVSTDDEEIAQVAREYGASVPFMRSAKTSGDYATTAEVIEEVLEEYRRLERSFERVCCLYPTAPFVSAAELRGAMEGIDSGATSVVAVTDFDFPPLRAFRLNADGSLAYAFPEYALARSQDLPPMIHDCGRFCIANVVSFEKTGSFITSETRPFMVSSRFVQDIDTLDDWAIAEDKFRIMNGGLENGFI